MPFVLWVGVYFSGVGAVAVLPKSNPHTEVEDRGAPRSPNAQILPSPRKRASVLSRAHCVRASECSLINQTRVIMLSPPFFIARDTVVHIHPFISSSFHLWRPPGNPPASTLESPPPSVCTLLLGLVWQGVLASQPRPPCAVLEVQGGPRAGAGALLLL